MKIWLNGKLLSRGEAMVSVYDHGVLYGDGVFEGIRAYGRRIFQCKAHIERFFESARQIRLTIPYTPQEVEAALRDTIAANDYQYSYLRPVVTRGEGNLGLNPFTCSRPTVFIINDHIQLYPRETYESGIALIIAKTLRTSAAMLSPSVKSLNYLNNIMAKVECIDAGVGEAIMLNDQGNVAECTGDNIFIVKGGTLITPPASAGILVGITRSVVLRLARQLEIPAEEKNFKPEAVYDADECFLTGTAAEVIPVTKVDRTTIATGKAGPITKKLTAAFHQYTQSPGSE
jgi:branched-chain amino acid aminotransferase